MYHNSDPPPHLPKAQYIIHFDRSYHLPTELLMELEKKRWPTCLLVYRLTHLGTKIAKGRLAQLVRASC